MFLAIDVGNSNIHLGEFSYSKGGKIPRMINYIAFPNRQRYFLNRLFSKIYHPNSIEGIIVSDAYGENAIMSDKKIKAIFSRFANLILLTPKTKCDLEIDYQPKSSLGTDRIANCVAGYEIYRRDCLVVDFGTATTFNFVSKQGKFLGGLITPGIKNSYNTLPQHLLISIKTKIKKPDIWALSTSNAIQSGVFFQLKGMVNEIQREIKLKTNKKFFTIATGGGVNLIPNIKSIFDDVNLYLTLKGLAIIYQKIVNNKIIFKEKI